MTLPDVIYWDYFAKEYCLKKDEYAAPERYMQTYKCCDGMFIERWEVTEHNEGNRLNIAFDEELYKGDLQLLARYRQYQFDKHHCRPIQMISFSIPKHLFEKYCLKLLEGKEE